MGSGRCGWLSIFRNAPRLPGTSMTSPARAPRTTDAQDTASRPEHPVSLPLCVWSMPISMLMLTTTSKGGRDQKPSNGSAVLASRACHHFRETPLHLLRRHFFEAMSDVPAMARGVTEPARALAVELVLRLALNLGACLGGTTDHRIRIVDLQMQSNRGAAQSQRSQDAVLRELFSQQERCPAEIEFGVPYAAVGIR